MKCILYVLLLYKSTKSLCQSLDITNSLRPIDTFTLDELGHHCFREWLVAYSTPRHYLNQCWSIVNRTVGYTFKSKYDYMYTRKETWNCLQSCAYCLILNVHFWSWALIPKKVAQCHDCRNTSHDTDYVRWRCLKCFESNFNFSWGLSTNGIISSLLTEICLSSLDHDELRVNCNSVCRNGMKCKYAFMVPNKISKSLIVELMCILC